MNENSNLFIAIAASVAIFIGWHFLYESPRIAAEKKHQEALQLQSDHSHSSVIQVPKTADVPKSREDVIGKSKRVPIITPTLTGSLNLRGGRIDDLVLTQYRETVEQQSPYITLFSPSGSEKPYFAEFGWTSAHTMIAFPNAQTQWEAEGEKLTPESPIVLRWNNGQGLIFERTISVDKDYLFTIKQKIINTTSQEFSVNAFGLVSRTGLPKTSGFMILHEGPLGYLNGALEEYSYKDLQEDGTKTHSTQGGWLGITDKYWLAALIPGQKHALKTNFRNVRIADHERFQIDYLSETLTLSPNKNLEITNHLFAGAKKLNLLDAYEAQLDIPHFDLAVDFGWFYFITKPLFHALTFLNSWLGNFGLAILLLTILLKLVFLPLANKSYRSMARMKELQPEMERIRTLYADDKMKMNQEVMDLYKREKANPLSGCMPMLIQIPVFFALYKVLFISIEMRQAPFFGWIYDLSAPDPTTVANLFGLIPWDPPSFLMLGAWPLIMGATMFLQQKLNPAPTDPAQAKVFMIMPFVFTIMLAQFPAGLVIYWAWNNILSIGQQWIIMKRAQQFDTAKKEHNGRRHKSKRR